MSTERGRAFRARYGDKWRSLRRGAHEVLTPQASMEHRTLQDAECAQLMYDVLRSPKVILCDVSVYDCHLSLL